jgi:predicted transposase YdaD
VKAVAETAREEALIEGEEKGRIEGRLEGKIEGKIEGREEGKIEEKIEGIVSALKRGKLTIEEIAEDFKTTVELVLKIKKESNL